MMMCDTHFVLFVFPLGQLFPQFIQNIVTVPTAGIQALVLWLSNSGQQHSTTQTRIPLGLAMKTKAQD